MDDRHDTQPAGTPRRASAMVADREAADRLVIDLTDRGIDPSRVTTRPSGRPGEAQRSSRATGEQDLEATEKVGKRIGLGAVVGGLVGGLLAAVVTSLLIGPPWENGLAAGITLAVALGAGWVFAGMGLLQTGIATAEERPPTAETNPDLLGHDVVVEVAVTSPEEADAADAVFRAHRADRID